MDRCSAAQRKYICNACEAIKIFFVNGLNDLDGEEGSFAPTLTHQIFTDEVIFGYQNLSIKIFYLSNSAHCYIELSYTDHFVDCNMVVSDSVMDLMAPWFPQSVTSLQEFLEFFEVEDKSKIYGTVFDTFLHRNKQGGNSTYKVTECSVAEEGFTSFHERYQSLIIMFIDAANFIDLTDERWMFFYLYEERSIEGNITGNFPIGFCTVYRFYAYPDKVRARISQFFIIPPHQGLGLGYKFLNAVYNALIPMNSVEEITVESPNAIFTKIRNNIDALRLVNRPEFSAENLCRGFSLPMCEAAHNLFKLSAKQARCVYEILRYYSLCLGKNTDYDKFREDFMSNRRRNEQKKNFRNQSGSAEGEDVSPPFDRERDFSSYTAEMEATVNYLLSNRSE